MLPQRQLTLSFEEFDPAEEVASLLVSDANEKTVSDTNEMSVSDANEMSASEGDDRFKVPEKKQRGRKKQSTETTRRLRSNTRKKTVNYTKYSDDEYDGCKYPSFLD